MGFSGTLLTLNLDGNAAKTTRDRWELEIGGAIESDIVSIESSLFILIECFYLPFGRYVDRVINVCLDTYF